jgi:hypothetical protein
MTNCEEHMSQSFTVSPFVRPSFQIATPLGIISKTLLLLYLKDKQSVLNAYLNTHHMRKAVQQNIII